MEDKRITNVVDNNYDGEFKPVVDEALSRPEVIGLSSLSPTVIRHLEETGQFRYKDGSPNTYVRGDRSYYYF